MSGATRPVHDAVQGLRGEAAVQGAFRSTRAAGSRAVIPFITAGDPSLEATVELTKALVAGGADLVEWGIPFSDPLADGVTIQQASQRALRAGTTSRGILKALRRLRAEGCRVPVVLMVYANVVLRYGAEAFVADAAAAGADGLIMPDVPLEESSELSALCRDQGLAWIPLVAPTSTDERIRRIAATGNGFVYCVSVTGVTGAREALAEGLPAFLSRVRRATGLPLAVGFGIATPEHARAVSEHADGVIIGSALIDHISGAKGTDEAAARAQTFIRAFKEAVSFPVYPPSR